MLSWSLKVEPGSPTRTPKTLEIRSSGNRAASLVTFLKSREGQLGLLSMAMLIFQGTALSLTLRFSRCNSPPHSICFFNTGEELGMRQAGSLLPPY